jgi:Subunit ChlI of Mg-chelatase
MCFNDEVSCPCPSDLGHTYGTTRNGCSPPSTVSVETIGYGSYNLVAWLEIDMLAKVLSAALVGIDAHLIDVEVDIAGGLPQFSIVGLPDATVRESRDRVRSALKIRGSIFQPRKSQ